MIDDHYYPDIYPAEWGVKPVLFHVGDFGVPAYSFFVLLGLIIGALIYFYESRRKGRLNEKGFLIAVGALVGGVIGAKLFQWIIDIEYVFENITRIDVLLSGRTIVGGLIGGTIGAKVTKHLLKIKEKRGNLFAPAIAMGVAIGRLGCFFRGCCYGKATSLPWGVDFGDGILRHPTQIYESLFMLAMFVYIQIVKDKKSIKPGQLFKRLMIAYFTFRFLIEFIRVERIILFGLTSFQIISIGVIIFLTKDIWMNINLRKSKTQITKQ